MISKHSVNQEIIPLEYRIEGYITRRNLWSGVSNGEAIHLCYYRTTQGLDRDDCLYPALILEHNAGYTVLDAGSVQSYADAEDFDYLHHLNAAIDAAKDLPEYEDIADFYGDCLYDAVASLGEKKFTKGKLEKLLGASTSTFDDSNKLYLGNGTYQSSCEYELFGGAITVLVTRYDRARNIDDFRDGDGDLDTDEHNQFDPELADWCPDVFTISI